MTKELQNGSELHYRESSINDLQRVMSQLLHKDHLGTE